MGTKTDPVARRARFHRPPRPDDVGRWRLITSPWRRWPDFLIIGTQRGGTTSFYEYLCRHPLVAPATEKEIHYFDFQSARGPAWYRAHFPWRWPARRITGEASPFYLFHPGVPARVRALLPGVRLLVLLRDPVERAHSHFRLQRRARIEPLASFEEALDAELFRLAGEPEKMARGDDYYSYNYQHYSYLARGHYAPQLARWLQYVSREQLLVLSSEAFYAQPEAAFDRACRFLGLPAAPEARLNPPRLNHQPGEPMLPATRARLQSHFAPHNAELARLLGESFDWPTTAG